MNLNRQNNGDSNINIDGNNNTVQINHYENTKPKRVVEDHQHNSEIHLTTDQQYQLKTIIQEIADMMNGIDGINYYAKIFSGLNKKYRVPKYSLINQEFFSEAKQYLKTQKNIYRKKLKSYSATRFKELTIPLIIIRWKYLGNEEDSLLSFASEKLNKNVNDIKKLSANELDTLYSRVYSIKHK